MDYLLLTAPNALVFLPIVAVSVFWWKVKNRKLGVLWVLVAGFITPRLFDAIGVRNPDLMLADPPTVAGRLTYVVPVWISCAAVFAFGAALPRKPDGKKKCPACAERVLADANVCRHCGHAFVASGSETATPGTNAA